MGVVSEFVGSYGEDWRQGVLSEHLEHVKDHLRQLVNGRVVVVDEYGNAWPIVCSELVEIWTEDGPIVGRCGKKVEEGGACRAHFHPVRESWAEIERDWDDYRFEEVRNG